MKNINKLVEIINNQINGKQTNNTYLDEENDIFEVYDLLNSVNYLYCYPDDKKFFNYFLINSAFKENKFFTQYIYKHENKFKKLMENENFSKGIEENGFFEPLKDESSIIEPFYYIDRYELINENTLAEFEHFKCNPYSFEKIFIYSNNPITKKEIVIASAYVPIEIHGDLKEKLLESTQPTNSDNAQYDFSLKQIEAKEITTSLSYNSHSRKKLTINDLNNRYKVSYIYTNGSLIFKAAYEAGAHERLKELESKFLVINKNGEKLNNKFLNAGQCFYDIRNAISHCSTYDYELSIASKTFVGKVFLIDEIDKTKKYNKAIICPNSCINKLMSGYCFNSNQNQTTHSFIYAPNLLKPVTNPMEAQEFQEKCKIIQFHFNGEIDNDYFQSLFEKTINEFNSTEDANLKTFLHDKLSKSFKILNINILDIKNIKWLDQQFSKNEAFFKLPFPNSTFNQNEFVKDITSTYFDPACFTNNYMNKTNNDLQLKMKPLGFNRIIWNIKALLETCNKKHIHSKEKFKFFQAYKSEVYHVLCIILAYNNLIKNGFSENFEYDNIKINLSSSSKTYTEQIAAQTNAFEQQLVNIDMSRFEVYDDIKKFDGVGRVPKKIDEKADIIRFIRNAICHSNIYIKYNKSGIHEENYIVFYSTNYNKCNPNNVVRIQAKDFIKFCQNPLFANYSGNNSIPIKGESLEEVINKITPILN